MCYSVYIYFALSSSVWIYLCDIKVEKESPEWLNTWLKDLPQEIINAQMVASFKASVNAAIQVHFFLNKIERDSKQVHMSSMVHHALR